MVEACFQKIFNLMDLNGCFKLCQKEGGDVLKYKEFSLSRTTSGIAMKCGRDKTWILPDLVFQGVDPRMDNVDRGGG